MERQTKQDQGTSALQEAGNFLVFEEAVRFCERQVIPVVASVARHGAVPPVVLLLGIDGRNEIHLFEGGEPCDWRRFAGFCRRRAKAVGSIGRVVWLATTRKESVFRRAVVVDLEHPGGRRVWQAPIEWPGRKVGAFEVVSGWRFEDVFRGIGSAAAA